MRGKFRFACGMAAVLLGAVQAFAQATVQQPTVVDKNGKTIGSLLNSNAVLLKLPSQQVIQTAVYQSGFMSSGPYEPANVYYYFKSTDCTGTGYLDAGLYPSLAVIDPRNVGFLVFAGPNPSVFSFGSYRIVSADSQACLKNFHGTVYGSLPERIALSRLGFTPPFVVRSQ